ncbi:uncharacterized protein GGS25DRAFT_55445 [Hypoxylon fragiforme]|uniref:uncharacterized protein n=1 Tax=Hypoxylon fragiforme TaxID=63214 RepID=UPI0020C6B41A|nr:uncharacterized protein GGS25DRAFT_55445 [Hypoxylon fragiforme]KAI2614539.1 hypothetical protein GGS25DRAFT_55445 [Hypoxylon fragiforme]
MERMESAGEGSSRLNSRLMTLGDAMRAPSINPPGVVVLDSLHFERDREEAVDPKEDLWLSSADGRYNSAIIPLRVGTAPDRQTFYVHKSVLIKADFFRKALCGEFMESEAQAIDLPEEDPAIFHFVVAFLYENKYVPIRAAATVLVADDKIKTRQQQQREEEQNAASDSDSSVSSLISDSTTARSQRQRDRRRRREDRHRERERRKHPGTHRPGCACRQCLMRGGPPCWNCGAPRFPPHPGPMPVHVPPGVVVFNAEPPRPRHRRHRHNRHRPPTPPPPAAGTGLDRNSGINHENRIHGQDLRTWLLTYEFNLDVYICANKFLLDDFKRAIARVCIDMLETAGADAAQIEVLRLCHKLYQGLPESDALLRMVFARVGFLNPHLWRRSPEDTSDFFHAHPEVSALMFKETLVRREDEHTELPAMERPLFAVGPRPTFPGINPRALMAGRRIPRGDYYNGM